MFKMWLFYLLCIAVFIFETVACTSQVETLYIKNIHSAKNLKSQKRYHDAAKYYSYTFSLAPAAVKIDDRYEAARCWSLIKKRDSAFKELNACVAAGYRNYRRISRDTAFDFIRLSPQWSDIITNIKRNAYSNNRWKSPNKKLNEHLIRMLDTIYTDDQYLRTQISLIANQWGWQSEQMNQHLSLISTKDAINVEKLKRILDKYGWLGKDKIGIQGNNTQFLVIQHAALAVQLQYLPLIKKAERKGDASSSQLALLQDRIAIRQGKKQIYGSQLMQNNLTGKHFVLPLKHPEQVDKRRLKVGLPPMKEYLKTWGIEWSIKNYRESIPKESINLVN